MSTNIVLATAPPINPLPSTTTTTSTSSSTAQSSPRVILLQQPPSLSPIKKRGRPAKDTTKTDAAGDHPEPKKAKLAAAGAGGGGAVPPEVTTSKRKPCEHGKNQRNCKTCKVLGTGGQDLCELHHHFKYLCIQCFDAGLKPPSICEHRKNRTQCKICGPLHKRVRAAKKNGGIVDGAIVSPTNDLSSRSDAKIEFGHIVDGMNTPLTADSGTGCVDGEGLSAARIAVPLSSIYEACLATSTTQNDESLSISTTPCSPITSPVSPREYSPALPPLPPHGVPLLPPDFDIVDDRDPTANGDGKQAEGNTDPAVVLFKELYFPTHFGWAV